MRGELLVVGGIPGAGKSTWLRDRAPAGHLVLDSEDVAARRRRRLPYRLVRPWVHTEHHLRIVRAVLRHPGPVAVHETATRRSHRRWLLRLARRAGRPARLHVLAVDARTAVARQHARGRVVSSAAMARHVRRAERMLAEAPAEGWAQISVTGAPTSTRPSAPGRALIPKTSARWATR